MNKNDDEIDLIQLIRTLWTSRFFIIKTTLVFILVGIFISLTSPIVYSASTTFIPQTSNVSSSSSLTGVASLVGIDLGLSNSGTEIPPSIYPQIIESVPYKRELLKTLIVFPEKNSNVSLKDYLLTNNSKKDFFSILKKYTLLLPFTLIELVRGDNNKKLSPNLSSDVLVSSDEEKLFKTLDGLLEISVNAKEGFVNLKTKMSDPYATALVAKAAEQILQRRIVEYKIKSAKEVLDFNLEQLSLKKVEFDSIQNKLALFKDSNLNIIDSRFQNSLQKLESEFNIVSSVYQELSKQVEQSKLQVSKDTPIFSVIKPATVPNKRTSPKRTQMVITFAFIGLTVGSLIVLLKSPILSIYREITA